MPPPSDRPTAADAGAQRTLTLGILLLVAVYLLLFLSGIRFFVYKTAIVPLFLAYALALRERRQFVFDWLPLLAATVLFDGMRGAIYAAIQNGFGSIHAQYVIDLEQMMIGTPAAPLVLQQVRHPALDAAAVAVHASHFTFFLLFGLALWHARRGAFPWFRSAMLLVMAGGLIGYALVPTVPPWMAYSQLGLLPPFDHIVVAVYTAYVPELYGTFDTNPVAAMPSLHAAFPVVCAAVGWRAFGRRAGIALSLYAILIGMAVMYLGEHYAVDVLAGVVLAGLGVAIGHRLAVPLSPRLALTASVVAVAVTAGLIAVTR